jgi:hypothetical protein
MGIRVGTSYFMNRQMAIKYYSQYSYEDVETEVDRKLREGEIHLGPPLIPSGHKLRQDDDGRYYTERA